MASAGPRATMADMRSDLRLNINAASPDGPHSVDGMPPNETALIMRIHGEWRFLRTVDDVSGGWQGSFESPEAALAALVAASSR